MARESGAKKVFVASSAPRVMFPNVYGIDMPTKSELICGDGKDDAAVAKIIGADDVIYLPLDVFKQALHELNPEIESFDCSCFDGQYVTGDITEEYLAKLSKNAIAVSEAVQEDDRDDRQDESDQGAI
jgi:amidophosphoribosyltransferase